MPSGSVLRSPRRNYRPCFDALETRDCPTGIPPTISTFNVMPAGPMLYALSGSVMDEAPGNLAVNFTGVYVGSVMTDAMGNFSVNVTPSQLGSITADVTDNEGLTATPVQRSCSSWVPQISLSASRQVNNLWQFSGMVMDEHAPGLTVNFGGLASLAGKSATVASDGTFSLCVDLAEGEEGTATAQTMDWWGHLSNEAQYIVQPSS